MGQLSLVFPPIDVPPDSRHPWGRMSFMRERQDEWRCAICGELATRNILDGAWEFLRVQLAKKPKGAWHWSNVSHDDAVRDLRNCRDNNRFRDAGEIVPKEPR
jgi:hypothetical protein